MSDDLAVAADGVHGLEVVTLFGIFSAELTRLVFILA